jgi:hypothetical protein
MKLRQLVNNKKKRRIQVAEGRKRRYEKKIYGKKRRKIGKSEL